MNSTFRGTHFHFLAQNLFLDPLKAIFWQERKMLIISDLHIGKAAHFRKSGIPIPKSVHSHDYQNMNSLISHYEPESLVFLGDLFHSDINDEWNDFLVWLKLHEKTHMILVKGNHDILSDNIYNQSNLIITDKLLENPFLFTHEKAETKYYNISGHIHPSIRLSGAARQTISLPCFYFAKESAVIPAFGNFTGYINIKPEKDSNVFAIAEHEIIALMG